MYTNRHPGFALLLSFFLLVPAWAGAEVSYEGVVIFGDSLSDTGNKFSETGVANTPPYAELLQYFLVADGPYTRGGLHHSNGAVWAEQFARPLGLGGMVRPALRSDGGAMNYAYGGARARLEPEIIDNENMHLPLQVDAFLADVNGMASEEALYVIFIGGNDVFDAVMALSADPTGVLSSVVLQNAIFSVGTEITRLHMTGARKFLVMNVPDLGVTPAVQIADAQFSNPPVINPGDVIAAASFFTAQFNLGLDMALAGLEDPGQEPVLPGIEIVRANIYSAFNEIIADPESFGFTNVTTACVTPMVPPYACKRPDEYLFWDGVHPTKATHGIIAAEVASMLVD